MFNGKGAEHYNNINCEIKNCEIKREGPAEWDALFFPGTLVGRIQATDADKANTSHTKIAYSIEKQEPYHGAQLFYIDRNTGSIFVKEATLDREVKFGLVFQMWLTKVLSMLYIIKYL